MIRGVSIMLSSKNFAPKTSARPHLQLSRKFISTPGAPGIEVGGRPWPISEAAAASTGGRRPVFDRANPDISLIRATDKLFEKK
jgi:hypothetical protein